MRFSPGLLAQSIGDRGRSGRSVELGNRVFQSCVGWRKTERQSKPGTGLVSATESLAGFSDDSQRCEIVPTVGRQRGLDEPFNAVVGAGSLGVRGTASTWPVSRSA